MGPALVAFAMAVTAGLDGVAAQPRQQPEPPQAAGGDAAAASPPGSPSAPPAETAAPREDGAMPGQGATPAQGATPRADAAPPAADATPPAAPSDGPPPASATEPAEPPSIRLPAGALPHLPNLGRRHGRAAGAATPPVDRATPSGADGEGAAATDSGRDGGEARPGRDDDDEDDSDEDDNDEDDNDEDDNDEDGDDLDEDDEDGRRIYGAARGEYRLRANFLGDIPLAPLPGQATGRLGQNFYGNQWLRVGLEIGLRPNVRVVGEADLFSGVVFGEFAEGVDAAAHARQDATAFPGTEPREAYFEWTSPIGLWRAGLVTSQWGLGILANDGKTEPFFGDHDFGDRSLRLAFGTKPAGEDSDVILALAGDVVFADTVADIRDGDEALQAVVALFYEKDERQVGVYAARRNQSANVTGVLSRFQEDLRTWAFDAFARWDFRDPAGGQVVAAIEAAYLHGNTSIFRSLEFDEVRIRQLMVAAQLERRSDVVDVGLETGYTSGDSNTEDSDVRRATMHPDHQIGLILFPEVMAWQTARTATLAGHPDLAGRPSPGSQLLPTNGGVAGATYLQPTVRLRLTDEIEARLGGVWAIATADVVDPYQQRAYSRSNNHLGGDRRNRDLGLELDASIRVRHELSEGVEVGAGLEGGVFFPGHAFDNEVGNSMETIGLFRVRGGIQF